MPNLSLPHLVDPLTAKGDFDWKGTRVGFDLKLTSPADLETRSARLDLALDTDAIDANFGGNVVTKPAFSAEGDLTAKSQSVPSLLAWLRKQPPTETAVGSGELSSHIAWQPGEITFTQARFALSHATGQGQAVVTLKSPRPHLRAALAAGNARSQPVSRRRRESGAASASEPAAAPAPPSLRLPPAPERRVTMSAPRAKAARRKATSAAQPPEAASPEGDGATSPNVTPAAFDADVNMNVRETKISRMTVGPSSAQFLVARRRARRDARIDAAL